MAKENFDKLNEEELEDQEYYEELEDEIDAKENRYDDIKDSHTTHLENE